MRVNPQPATLPTRKLEQVIGQPHKAPRMADQTQDQPLAQGRVGFVRTPFEGFGRRLHGRSQRVQLVRYVRREFAPRLLVHAQLIGQAVEGLHQCPDLLATAARLRQWRGKRRRVVWAKWQAGGPAVRQRQGGLGNLSRWPGDGGGQQ